MKTLKPVPTLGRSIATGAIGFCVVSLCVLATVAFGERWMYTNLTVLGAYFVWTALFILLGGAVLGSLVVIDRWRFPKFYMLFGPAFFLYAVGWTASYFTVRDGAGEWLGSLAGSILMALVFAVGFRAMRSALKFSAILFVANSLGYFLGAALLRYSMSKTGMILFGLIYGVSLGAGLGAVLHLAQNQLANNDNLAADLQ